MAFGVWRLAFGVWRLAFGVFVFVSLWIGYLWLTHIDNIVSDGEAYGFSIGSSKELVYSSVPKNISDIAVSRHIFFTEIEVSEELADEVGSVTGSQLLIQTRFHPDGFVFF